MPLYIQIKGKEEREMKRNDKSRSELTVAKVLLVTALINAVSTLIELIIKLISLE